MIRSLVISVRFHDNRYHGSGAWPPSPARLFQALIAGSAGIKLSADHRLALLWLEEQPAAPLIAAPAARSSQPYSNFVPNNDLDAMGGNTKRIGKIRTAKAIRSWSFDGTRPVMYAWIFEPHSESEVFASTICRMADGLYQLGRGVDMAWAVGEVIESLDLEKRLAEFSGHIYRPSLRGNNLVLDGPETGSLASLEERFAANCRFTTVRMGGKTTQLFTQAPRPRFRQVPYDSPTTKLLFDLRQTSTPNSPFSAWPLVRTAALVRVVRGNDGEDGHPTNGAFKRLADALPGQIDCIRRVLIGRDASEVDKSTRPRIVPLPSIGHVHVERSIRRVLVDVPPNCPLRVDDLTWALSGLIIDEKLDTDTGELTQSSLVLSDDSKMLNHYGVGEGHSASDWRSVTPVALPRTAARRRIGPKRLREEAKSGRDRQAEQSRAAAAVLHALRHADIRTPVFSVRVQREPFSAKGARAELFAPGTRFAKKQLWHVEIRFDEPVSGPLVLGDGRYFGLGLMEPRRQAQGFFALSILRGLKGSAHSAELCYALRRAVMSRVQEFLGPREHLPTFFSGHESDGAPARSGVHRHLSFAADLPRNRMLIVAPHLLEGRSPIREEREHLQTLESAIVGFTDLRAGAAGVLQLAPLLVDAEKDPVFAAAPMWESATPYAPTRHMKDLSPTDALISDLVSEMRRRNMVRPENVEILEIDCGPRGELAGRFRLQFRTAITGPVLLGRTCHLGGGMFVSANR